MKLYSEHLMNRRGGPPKVIVLCDRCRRGIQTVLPKAAGYYCYTCGETEKGVEYAPRRRRS